MEYLLTDDGHQLAVYTRGNPNKPAVIMLHGGPGGSIRESSFDIFDLDAWYVIAFDQRGCGKSKPFASLHNNTIMHAVKDMEQIRKHYKIESWLVYGGSYGATLALCYAIDYPQFVTELVLRGVFLGRDEDIKWLYQEGCSYFFPEAFEQFKLFIDEDKRDDLVAAYYEIFSGEKCSRQEEAAKVWADWEQTIVRLVPILPDIFITDADISLALLECHFFANHMFWDDDNMILNNVARIKHIPTYIVHGRYDVDCRLSGAYELSNQLDKCILYIAESSGHSGDEPNIKRQLIRIMRDLSQGSKSLVVL